MMPANRTREAFSDHFYKGADYMSKLTDRLNGLPPKERALTISQLYGFVSSVQKFCNGTAFFVGGGKPK